MDRFRTIWQWYRQTAMLLGIPILLILLSVGFQKVVFTATCQIAGTKCEYAIGASGAMETYMGELLMNNPDVDVVSRPRKK